jgi:hypothetical protein
MNVFEPWFRENLKEFGEKFDSHKVILTFAQANQKVYVELLSAIESDKPFQHLHSNFGRTIKKVCVENIYQELDSKHRSLDIFGQKSLCVLWAK